MSESEQLDSLYAELPTIDCQGHCWDSCGPIDMSNAEQQRIAVEAGTLIPRGSFFYAGPYTCPALTWAHQCSVYEIRPLICRIWGLTKRMPCTYGCRPSRWLTEPEAYELIARAHDISGSPREAEMARLATRPEHQKLVGDIRDRLDADAKTILDRRNRNASR